MIRRRAGLRVRLLEPCLATALLFGSLFALQAVQDAFPLAERWAELQVAAGAPKAEEAALAQAYRVAYGYETAEGGWAPYAVGVDSYYYLRLAERILESGSACGSSAADGCRDPLVGAPPGRPLVDARSPHPRAIALLHRIATSLDPQQVLLQSGRLLNLLLLGLAGLLAFLLLRPRSAPGAAGLAGSLVGALAVCLHPYVLSRTLGVDDDVWTLALLLAGVLCAAQTLEARRPSLVALGSAMAAGLACALLALAWGGWIFLLVLLVVGGGLAAVRQAVALRRAGVGRALAGFAPPAFLLLACLAAALLVEPGFLEAAMSEAGRLLRPEAVELLVERPPPDSFSAVAELQVPGAAGVARQLGWPALLLAGVGLACLLLRLRRAEAEGLGWLLLPWLLGALLLIGSGERYLLVLVPPVMLLAGLGLARLLATVAGRSRGAGLTAACLATATALGGLGWQAFETVADNRPGLDSAWVHVLAGLRETSPPDTLVLAPWEAGHWVTFWSRRAVVADGASLRDPRVHVPGRLLAADADQPLGRAIAEAACPPAPDPCAQRPLVLVTPSSLLESDGWMISGLWQPERAWVLDALAFGEDRPSIVAGLAAGGLGEAEAAVLLEEAEGLLEGGIGRRERALFAAPQARIWSRGWHGCALQGDGSYACPLAIDSADGWHFESFLIDPAQPAEATFLIRNASAAAAAGEAEPLRLAPSVVRLALADTLVELAGGVEGDSGPGVLMDTVTPRVFIGTPALLRSLAVRLLLLEGRFSGGVAEPLGGARTIDGSLVQAWRLGSSAASAQP